MTPIEAAARAICRAEHIVRYGSYHWRMGELDRRVEQHWEAHIPTSRAALAAIRDPSEAMIRAGEGETTPEGCWSMMIDAALADYDGSK